MHIEKLSTADIEDFVHFCLKHRSEVGDSYLEDEELASFTPNTDNPTFVAKKDGRIFAAASLILDDYHRRGRNGRFRIFYAENNDAELYSLLLQELKAYLSELDRVFVFVPEINKSLSSMMIQTGFEVERYVYVLGKNITDSPIVTLPEDYAIREFQPNSDEDNWCYIRNISFANLKGNTTTVTPEMIKEPTYLDGKLIFLTHQDEPIGIARVIHDDEDGEPVMNIGPLGILPDYQKKGLGRQLLRSAILSAKGLDCDRVILCVNGDNEKAKELYLSEGFEEIEGVIAYEYFI